MKLEPFLSLGYYADWTTLVPQKIGFSCFTHLCHAFALVKPDGTVTPPKDATAFCNACKKANVTPLLSIGGADTGRIFAQLTTSPTARKRTIDTILRFVTTHGYAGVDVDWEFPANLTERDQLTAFVRDLRTRLGQKRLLTMAVPASNWSGQWYDANALAPYVHYLHAMTYDAAGPWSEKAEHHAPLSFFQQGMTYWTKRGFPKEKLLLGIPLYGRGFPVKQWGVTYPKTAKNPFAEVSYNTLKREHAPLATTVNIGESFIVGLDTPESAAEKTHWARKQDVAGVFFWEISQDFDGKTHTIVAATQATG